MPRLPVLKPHEVVTRLVALGFVEVRRRTNSFDIQMVVVRPVPFHKGQYVSPVLFKKIARDIGISAEDLVAANSPPPGGVEPLNS